MSVPELWIPGFTPRDTTTVGIAAEWQQNQDIGESTPKGREHSGSSLLATCGENPNLEHGEDNSREAHVFDSSEQPAQKRMSNSCSSVAHSEANQPVSAQLTIRRYLGARKRPHPQAWQFCSTCGFRAGSDRQHDSGTIAAVQSTSRRLPGCIQAGLYMHVDDLKAKIREKNSEVNDLRKIKASEDPGLVAAAGQLSKLKAELAHLTSHHSSNKLKPAGRSGFCAKCSSSLAPATTLTSLQGQCLR